MVLHHLSCLIGCLTSTNSALGMTSCYYYLVTSATITIIIISSRISITSTSTITISLLFLVLLLMGGQQEIFQPWEGEKYIYSKLWLYHLLAQGNVAATSRSRARTSLRKFPKLAHRCLKFAILNKWRAALAHKERRDSSVVGMA